MPTHLIFDGHNDTLTQIFNSREKQTRTFFEQSNIGQNDLPRAQQGGLAGGFYAIFTPPPMESPEIDPMYGVEFTENGYIASERHALDPDYAQGYVNRVIDYAYGLMHESKGSVTIPMTVAALDRCLNSHVHAMVLALEGAEAIHDNLDNLADYYQRGIRAIGLVWSRPNVFGYGVPFRFPHSPDIGPGLTEQGKQLIQACNQLGILIDMAHLNEKGFWDVAAISTAPLVVTHADVYNLCPSTRNLTDAQIDAIAESGGVIGINFEAMNTHPASSVERNVPLTQITDHIDYIVQRVGIDHVAFGSDFDGAEMPVELSDVRGLPALIDKLARIGYDELSLEKIARTNWLRVIHATWKE